MSPPKIQHKNAYNNFLDELDEDVMGFLNEVQLDYSNAISLASGRPDESFFDLEYAQEYMEVFTNYLLTSKRMDKKDVVNLLGQYNRTKGIINELIVKYLAKDYGIKVHSNDTLINVGTQESLILTVMTLCNKDEDVLVIEDPTYIGISHFSLLGGYETAPVPISNDGLCLDTLEKKIISYRKKKKKVKLVYVIPDFQNPTGIRMSINKRIRLLELADKYEFFIVEDNAYADFVLEGPKYPTIKSLDKNQNVIYLHSFSKIVHPSLRIGVMVTGKIFEGNTRLSDLMAKLKGYTTVNTPSLTQSILGGMLIKNKFSFQEYNSTKLKNLYEKRTATLKALEKYFVGTGNELLDGVSWNSPYGGYFLTLTLPVKIDKQDVLECAKNYAVIFTPMSFFYMKSGGENQIRIAYSNVKENMIDKAIENLSLFLLHKINCEYQASY